MIEQITESSAENNEIINNNVAPNEDTNSTRGDKQEVSDPLLELLREEEEAEADGQIVRAKSNFSLMAAAGEAAISKGFLKWPEGSSIRACAEIFNAWIQNRGGVESHEDIQLINDTKIFLQQDSNARFEIIGNGCEQQEAANPDTKKTIYRQAGFKELIESKWVMYVFTDVFDYEVITGLLFELTTT